MPIRYEVNGYDRQTGDLAWSLDVPEWRVPSVLRIAGVPPSDDGLGSYPLQAGQVSEIVSLLETTLEQRDLAFFLEPYEAPQKAVG
jgi:hypothetical protein